MMTLGFIILKSSCDSSKMGMGITEIIPNPLIPDILRLHGWREVEAACLLPLAHRFIIYADGGKEREQRSKLAQKQPVNLKYC